MLRWRSNSNRSGKISKLGDRAEHADGYGYSRFCDLYVAHLPISGAYQIIEASVTLAQPTTDFSGARCGLPSARIIRHALGALFSFAAILLAASTVSARAIDEIQVYNAEIAKVGQWTFQLHSNYAFIGRKEPDFPGGLVPNHALQGTGEWAYGITDWWEMGFYTPFAVDQELTPYSNAAKIRQLFVTPNAAERSFFYGVTLSSATPLMTPPQHGKSLSVCPGTI
jgi:hypothetical protein